jgi:septal ring factor EnvC (AmiA/AmiB activator)
MQFWTTFDEDEQVQQWDQEEERLSTTMQELKNRHKTMSIIERLKGNQDLKKLQADLKSMQKKKQERQVEIEPLQEKVAQIIMQLEEEKKNMAQAQMECASNDTRGGHSASTRGTNRKIHAGPSQRKGTCRQVPQPSRGCPGNVQCLGGSG